MLHATPCLFVCPCLDVQPHHDDESQSQDYIKPYHIFPRKYVGEKAKDERPHSGHQHPDYPKSETGMLQKEQRNKYRNADKQTQRRVEREKVVAAYPRNNAQGDTVKKNDMPDEQANHKQYKADCKP